MRYGKPLVWGLALASMLVAGNAHADIVTYATSGVFASSNTSTFTSGNVSIVYNAGFGIGLNVNPSTLVTFGTFNTSATALTATTPVTVTDTFTLTITQTAPTGGTGSFVGTLSGTLSVDTSNAFVRFTGPLALTIGNSVYSILSADNNTPGRVNISPRNANAGTSTIAGQITIVPEPSTMALTALGGSVLLGLGHRSRRRTTTTVEV